MIVRQIFSEKEYQADLISGELESLGLGTLDPFAFEIIQANAGELAALPDHWRELYNPK